MQTNTGTMGLGKYINVYVTTAGRSMVTGNWMDTRRESMDAAASTPDLNSRVCIVALKDANGWEVIPEYRAITGWSWDNGRPIIRRPPPPDRQKHRGQSLGLAAGAHAREEVISRHMERDAATHEAARAAIHPRWLDVNGPEAIEREHERVQQMLKHGEPLTQGPRTMHEVSSEYRARFPDGPTEEEP